MADETIHRRGDSGHVARSAPIPLLKRKSRIAGCFALRFGRGKGNVAAGEVARITLAEARCAHVPPGVSAKRCLQDMRAQPVNVVAVDIDLWRERRVFDKWDRRLDRDDPGEVVGVVSRTAIVHDVRVENTRRPCDARNAWKPDLIKRNQAAVVEPRVKAGWRQGAVRHPLLECNKQRADIVGVGIGVG